MSVEAFSLKLQSAAERVLKRDLSGFSARQLSGGASMETWLFTSDQGSWVLRRVPNGESMTDMAMRISMESEVAVIQAARKNGVIVPSIPGILESKDEIGVGFFMEHLTGEALPQKLYRDEKYNAALDALTEQTATQLAKIHAIDTAQLESALPYMPTSSMLAMQEQIYRDRGGDSPIFEHAFATLHKVLPPPGPERVIQGDFRMGNLLVTEDGLSGVLDWEQSRLGDAAQDIGWLCTPSWRFGNYDQFVGGFGQLDQFMEHYVSAGGQKFGANHIRFWVIYGVIYWGIVCLNMIARWRDGFDRTLEKTVIGRRFSECEIDLLLLLEDEHDHSLDRLEWAPPEKTEQTGVSTDGEIVSGLTDWHLESVLPHQTGLDLFKARVARNALGILERERTYRPVYHDARRRRQNDLGLSDTKLKQKLRDGEIGLDDPHVLTHLRLLALENISIDQPKYAGYEAAKRKWTSL